MDAAQIAPDRARLDALDGYVLLLFSDSFHGKETQLTPGADVTLIGSYGEFRPDSAVLPLSADTAKPYSGTQGLTPPTPVRGPAGSALTILAVVAACLILLWWLLT